MIALEENESSYLLTLLLSNDRLRSYPEASDGPTPIIG